MDIKINPRILTGTISAPASKSFAHRLLISAALADSESNIIIDNFSSDIKATVSCLENMGVRIIKDGDNFHIIPPEKFHEPALLSCGESASSLRFLIPVVSAAGTEAVFITEGRLSERPLETIIEIIKAHGITVISENPLHIKGTLKSGKYQISGNLSSQFTTGLLLALSKTEGNSILEVLPPFHSRPYVDITLSVLKSFGADITEKGDVYYITGSSLKGQTVKCEGDWSNAAFLICAGASVGNLNINSPQGDRKILDILKDFGASVKEEQGLFSADISLLHAVETDASDIPDLVPVIAVLAATAEGTTVIKNIKRLRFKESNRIESTASLVNALGGKARTTEDSIIIDGVKALSGGTADSLGDHRIAMAAALAAVRCINPVIIKNADAVSKSYPMFFKDFLKLGGDANVIQLR